MNLEYDQAGLETRRHLPGGVVADWQHDRQGRLTRQSVTSPTAGTWSREYHWSFDDRITRIDDTRFGASTYDHDPRGRLIAEHRADTTLHRAVDEVGNVYRSPDRTDRRYVRGGILRNDGETAFAFDLLGNMVERALPDGTAWRYGWDGTGMLREVVRPNGVKVTFAYDALGRRVSMKVGGTETRWIWDRDVLLHELKPDATTTWCHDPESFTPIARVAHDEACCLVSDHLGVPTAIYDSAGGIVGDIRLDLFGARHVSAESAETPDATLCPQRWPGQWEDRETGLHYNRFRYYDPYLGTYLSQDPIGLVGGPALYGYVNDPLIWADPWGLEGQEVVVRSIREALTKASDFAKVPRVSRGGEPIPLIELDERSRGPNFRALQSRGVASLGRRYLATRAEFFLHPDGHPHQVGIDENGKPFPEHHKYPHAHGTNAQGDKRIFVVKETGSRGGCG